MERPIYSNNNLEGGYVMKRVICLVIAVLLIIASFTIISANVPKYSDPDKIINTLNNLILEKYGIDDYFSDKNIEGKSINKAFIDGSWWGNMTEQKNPIYLPVYGAPWGDKKTVPGGIRNRYLGYTVYDENFPNMFFPDDTVLSVKYDDRDWIENPWDSDKIEAESGYSLKYLCRSKEKKFDYYKLSSLPNPLPSDYFRESIIYGMGIIYGMCEDANVINVMSSNDLRNRVENKEFPANTKLSGSFLKKDWENYVHIIVPPTDISWGIGRIWRDNGTGKCNYLTIPLAPLLISNPEITVSPSPTPTSLLMASPTPLNPSPAAPTPTTTGVIKFDPPSCNWRNTPLDVRVYVEGNKTATKSGSTIRPYNYTSVIYYPETGNTVQVTQTGYTYWGFTQSWSIGNINVTGMLLPQQKTVSDNGIVTLTKEGIASLSASLSGWKAGSKTWNAGNAPIGNWASGSPGEDTSAPSQNYASTSGIYKIDLTVPTLKFNWDNQDWYKDGKHGFIYAPENKINITVGDNLSGINEVKYAWTQDSNYPDPSTMSNIGITTPEGTNSTASTSIMIHDTQDRIKDWYLHVYVKDRAGNVSRSTQQIYIECSLNSFRITDITDRQWEDVFWNPNYATGVSTGRCFYVNEMPVDRHPTKKIVAKKGYAFYFDISSKGLNGNADTVKFTPRFYYIKSLSNEDIMNAYEVDLYYDLDNEYLIKYGSDRDKFVMNYKMNGNFYNIGGLGRLTLNKDVRSISDSKNATWYGRFALMPSTKAVKKDTPIVVNGKVNYDVFLKKGYILVNFKIEGYKNGTKVFDYTPDEWGLEGGPKDKNLYYAGDTIIFDLEHSALDDYGTGTDR